ncbi:MAG TPA: tetratricopeptide repeat protein [Polyangia bacterium]|nr:tetratricopeptide repeat protein [Polyangia bacterium]
MTRSRARVVASVFALLVAGLATRASRAEVDPCGEAAVAGWKALESRGGIVPEIEEDRTQAPPAWWSYPSPARAAALFAAEASDSKGLYARVAPDALKAGDVLVRAVGAGACGKMAALAGRLDERWMVQDAREADGATRVSDDAFFVDGKTLRPEVAAYRINVKSDSTLGHVRELERDLSHLERTIAERPPLLAKGGRGAVDEKVHELVDEAWSLMADPAFDLERRVLAGRALALAAALDWPGAAESAAAVLDDVRVRAPTRADTAVARASVYLLAGEADEALTLASTAAALPNAPPRARYVLGRALLAAGKPDEGLATLRRYLAVEPGDPRASRLVATSGAAPALAPPPAADPMLAALRFVATANHAGATSAAYGFHVDWPIPWRVVGQSETAENGLLLDLATERVLDEDGEAQRGAVVVLAQRPATPAARAALVKKAARNMFPDAKLKALPPLVPGTRHESFRERGDGDAAPHAGEVTTLERAGVVCFVVLNAPARATAKLKDEYAALVKSLTFARTSP